MSQRLVRFKRNELPYMAGETASFTAKIAEKLVKRGSASYADQGDAPAAGEKPAPEAGEDHEQNALPLTVVPKDKLKRVDPATIIAKD